MKNLTNKTKFFIFVAFAIVVLLVAVNIALIVSNHVVQNKLTKQQQQIEELKDKVASKATIRYSTNNIEVCL